MAVTLKEIALATGFSKPTVARILREPGAPFRPETRDAVLTAARTMGYRPNAAAKAINSGKFGAVVLILGIQPARSYIHEITIHGMEEALALNDMNLVIARMPDQHLTARGFVPKVLRQHMADGMVVNYTHEMPERMLELINESNAPAVFLNTVLERDCVHPDDFRAGQTATSELIRLGHRDIVYIHLHGARPQQFHYSVSARRDGYIAAMKAAGLTPIVACDARPIAEHPAIMQDLLRRTPRPTAVVAASDESATLAIYESMLAGLKVPQDISVFGIVNRYEFNVAGHYMTSLLLPAKELGLEAIAAMLQHIEHPQQSLPARAVPFIRQEGTTCARNASAGRNVNSKNTNRPVVSGRKTNLERS